MVPDSSVLARYATVRRQLRDVPGLTEKRPGVYAAGSTPVVEFDQGADGSVALVLKRPVSSSAATRFAADDPVATRKLVDELKRIVARLADDA